MRPLGLVSLLAAVGSGLAQTDFTLRSWTEAYELANATVAQLTLSEKIGLVIGVGQFSSRCVGNVNPVARLGIPGFCLNDGPAGVRPVKAEDSCKRGGWLLAKNSAEKASICTWVRLWMSCATPWLDGGWESFGPDPYLNGEAAFETITGVQSVGVMACAKHFIANSQEHWRYGYISEVDDRTMHEIYHYPFIRAIEANVSAVMCAYNQFNGTSSCHNANLIGPTGLLRKDGFQGFIVSDWGATHDSASDNANAGLDMEQPGDYILIGGGVFSGFLGIGSLEDAVNDGSVPLARLNQMITRILAPWYRLGQNSGYPAVNFDAQHSDGSGSLNLNVSHVAIIGLDAIIPNLNCGDSNQCDDGTMTIGWGSGSNSLDFTVPPITALNETFAGTGAVVTTSLTNDDTAAAKAAKGQDVAIVLANAMSGELGFYQVVDGVEGDRNDLNLWFDGNALIEAVAAVCSNTIVVVHSVGPVDMSWATNPNITGIIYAGAPGEQSGPGLVDVLFGAVNPTGRLPFSIADSPSSYGTTIVTDPGFPLGFPTIDYTERLLLDYRYMDQEGIAPRFEYGFGLSYTTFAYSGLSITTSGTSQVISFTVKNTGAVTGTEKPQLYLWVPLAAGASQLVTMTVAEREMSVWDTPSQSWVRPAGTFTVYVGASSRDIRLTGSF
ncbi:Glycoside hydrolase family 3 protein [Mycena sanguinolenta]|uniref:beta-glucosidase n=1 Tax=Mycena sanguinolenta TaxID=230812 RepID=A0A8H7D962_9AGAR|nr:Glycoside hydrolase family 3 protein [Mycena sanguinolenta]